MGRLSRPSCPASDGHSRCIAYAYYSSIFTISSRDVDRTISYALEKVGCSSVVLILNSITMKCLIRGILKDMRLTWVSVKPVANIPYQSVCAAPHGWEGNQEDPEDTNERHRLPEELVPQSLSPNSSCSANGRPEKAIQKQ